MIVVLKDDISIAQREWLISWFEEHGCTPELLQGSGRSILNIIDGAKCVDAELVASFDCVESVSRLNEQYEKSSRKNHPDNLIIKVGDVEIGKGFVMIAGPCSVESEEQIVSIAKAVKESGAQLLRGGAYKPRSSPYDFQGLQADGLRLLSIAKRETGMPIVSEVMGIRELSLFDDVDIIQVGARNMQNYELLRELGRVGKPVLLKRGFASTLRELLLSAEYIISGGNEQVILCERGVRSFDDLTRNTLDIAAVPMLKELSCLPVLVDPSHATGRAALVQPMAMAAAACGADGVMIEVHDDPVHALSDGAQAIRSEEFAALAKKLRSIRKVVEE